MRYYAVSEEFDNFNGPYSYVSFSVSLILSLSLFLSLSHRHTHTHTLEVKFTVKKLQCNHIKYNEFTFIHQPRSILLIAMLVSLQ